MSHAGPCAYDLVVFTFVRFGSARLLGPVSVSRRVGAGDVVVLGPGELCGVCPTPQVTATMLAVDEALLVDLVFWRHEAGLVDRWDAKDFASELYGIPPAQFASLGADRLGLVSPWLDELVALSVEGRYEERFHRMAGLLLAVLDVVSPLLIRADPGLRERLYARRRRVGPLRREALAVRELLSSQVARRWRLSDLAAAVHMSSSQVARVFTNAFGKTPAQYLVMLRVEQMARLIRETSEPVKVIAARVGWTDASYAAARFRELTGVNPSQYRLLARDPHTTDTTAGLARGG